MLKCIKQLLFKVFDPAVPDLEQLFKFSGPTSALQLKRLFRLAGNEND